MRRAPLAGPAATVIVALATADCASVLGLDPGTAAMDAGSAEAAADAGQPADDAAVGARRCAEPVPPGVYCDDFDEAWRVGPGGREATPMDGELTLVNTPARSAPRALRAAFSAGGRAMLALPRDVPDQALRVTVAVWIPKGNTRGRARLIALSQYALQREYHVTLDFGSDDAALELRSGGGLSVLVVPRRVTYETWHDVTLVFRDRDVFLQLDELVVQEVMTPIEGPPVDIQFGLQAFDSAVVYLDDVEISTRR